MKDIATKTPKQTPMTTYNYAHLSIPSQDAAALHKGLHLLVQCVLPDVVNDCYSHHTIHTVPANLHMSPAKQNLIISKPRRSQPQNGGSVEPKCSNSLIRRPRGMRAARHTGYVSDSPVCSIFNANTAFPPDLSHYNNPTSGAVTQSILLNSPVVNSP